MKKLFILLLCFVSYVYASTVDIKTVKVGFIFSDSVNDEGLTQSFNEGRLELEKNGITTMFVENIPSNNKYSATVHMLIRMGCNIIYSCNKEYQNLLLDIAGNYPNIKFLQYEGETRTFNLSTFAGKMYESCYLAGIAAGLKTQSNRIGYIAGFPIEECLQGINAFTLGLHSVNPDASIDLKYTYSWSSPSIEEMFVKQLAQKECDVIAHQQNSTSVQKECKNQNISSIGYNYPSPKTAPESYMTACIFDWSKFMLEDTMNFVNGKWYSKNYWEGLSSNTTNLDELTDICVPGTEKIIEETKRKISGKSLTIFKGPIYDDKNNLKLESEAELTEREIQKMDWLIQGVTAGF